MIRVFPRAWGNPMLHFYFHFFPTALGPFIQETLLSTPGAGVRPGSAGRTWLKKMWCTPWETISKRAKLPRCFGEVLLGSDPHFLLFCVFLSSCVIPFYFVPLPNLARISPPHCTYLIMPHVPSLEAEATSYSYSYSKGHNGRHIVVISVFLICWI